MQELITALPALSGLIEKAGIVGVLIIFGGMLSWEVLRLRRELAKTYQQRDKWRLAFVTVKAAADNAGARYDLSHLTDMVDAEIA